MRRVALGVVVVGLLVAACGPPRPGAATSGPAAGTSRAQGHAAGSKTVSFDGVRLTIPASWPVIDGAHARNTCSSTFGGQPDRAFLGVSYQGVPSCGASLPGAVPTPAAGVWMQPGGTRPPSSWARSTLPGGQVVYRYSEPSAASVRVWYRRVMIEIGIGPDPAVQRQILDSIAFRRDSPDTEVLGRCPAPGPSPPNLPVPARLTTTLTLADGDAYLRPEPSKVRPRVTAATVWAGLFRDFGGGGFAGPLEWSIVFGSYTAKTPAHINHDGSETPFYRGTPTWLIRGNGVKTPYGPCGITVIAPYNADTGRSMGVETIG